MRLEKVFGTMLFTVFFLCLHFWLRSWALAVDSPEALCNAGGPFGVPLERSLLVVAGLLIGIFLIREWRKEDALLGAWPWVFILAGGAGNLLERVFFGCIMDYIALPPFPVFNAADILLTLGAAGFLLRWRKNVNDKKKNSI